MVGLLLGGTDLNHIVNKGCLRTASADRWKQWELAEKVVILRRKDLADGSVQNRLQKATENGAWITEITHRINSTEFSWEEFQDNIPL